jgi:hypothetical protein
MPPHVTIQGTLSYPEDLYVDYVRSIADRFSLVVVCVSQQCAEKGIWVGSFERAGIPCLLGAGIQDANALLRMRAIFDTFEYVTTNSFGSHVAYGAAFWAKVSVAGPDYRRTQADLMQELYYQKNPELAEAALRPERWEMLCKRYWWTRVDPWDARENMEEGLQLIGFKNRRSWEELGKLLGFSAGSENSHANEDSKPERTDG